MGGAVIEKPSIAVSNQSDNILIGRKVFCSSQSCTRVEVRVQVTLLEVAEAVRPATSANAGLTSATARPPGLCNFSLLALPCIHR